MMSRSVLCVVTLLLVFLAAVAQDASGDVITLRSGEVIEGEVIEVTRTKVTVKIKLHNIPTTQTYRRSEVKDIEYKPLPDGFWDPPRRDDSETDDDDTGTEDTPELEESEEGTEEPRSRSRRSSSRSSDPDDMYVVVPIEGGIGSEVTADGVRKALTQAKGRKAGHIVFVVDSPGGYVYEAVNFLEVLKEFDEDFVYHCVIDAGAISAAAVFAAASDHIYVRPDARLGGAVAYTTENTSGAAEVDAKFNSIWSANIASRADSKGHQGDVFRAMVVLEAELWQGPDGTLSAAAIPGGTKIDGADTILTIRASQMVDGGMARAFEGGIDTLGELVGRDNWTEVPGVGVRAMTLAARERADMQRRYDTSIAEYRRELETFNREHPNSFQYRVLRYDNGVYRLDPRSMREWVARSDRTIRACERMLRYLKELASINSKAERTGALHLVTPKDLGHEAYVELDRSLSWLKAHRNNPPAREMANPTFGP